MANGIIKTSAIGKIMVMSSTSTSISINGSAESSFTLTAPTVNGYTFYGILGFSLNNTNIRIRRWAFSSTEIYASYRNVSSSKQTATAYFQTLHIKNGMTE